ncbi:hypothetical protein [Chryseobacterium sp.]|uniref:hypothetical protein n=1 Tax=Chryseobacterium sp. TaxID=1871047 RepID=UPI000EBA2C91|nr:hypothetical protein [Chryseobacterium sp.]HCA08957.1 hypothetical protein [Chryseobacterium sp.]
MNSTKSAFSIIEKELRDIKGKNQSIIAGHYCIADGLEDLSNEGESEVHSFELGLESFKYLKSKGNKVSFNLWINDIGVDISFRKEFKELYKIPENYLMILDQYDVKSSALDIYFESSVRNRAMLEFRKRYKVSPEKYTLFNSNEQSLVRCINNDQCEISESKTAYTIMGPDGNPIVMREGASVKCNLILATLLHLVYNKHQSEDIIHISNDIYVDRVRLGEYVASEVYNLKSYCHSFFCDEENSYKKDWS